MRPKESVESVPCRKKIITEVLHSLFLLFVFVFVCLVLVENVIELEPQFLDDYSRESLRPPEGTQEQKAMLEMKICPMQ